VNNQTSDLNDRIQKILDITEANTKAIAALTHRQEASHQQIQDLQISIAQLQETIAKLQNITKPDIVQQNPIPPPPNLTRIQKILSRLNQPFLFLEKRAVEPFANWLDRWDLFRILEKVGFAIAVLLFISEMGDRQQQTHYEAWQVINSASGQKTDGGRKEAMQALVKDRISLNGINAEEAHLPNIDLKDADLTSAKLNNAILQEANLENAQLFQAELKGADLISANLKNADLRLADLTDATLTGANLEGAKFCNTTMPDGTLSNQDCP
jgi:hypothetical protein